MTCHAQVPLAGVPTDQTIFPYLGQSAKMGNNNLSLKFISQTSLQGGSALADSWKVSTRISGNHAKRDRSTEIWINTTAVTSLAYYHKTRECKKMHVRSISLHFIAAPEVHFSLQSVLVGTGL